MKQRMVGAQQHRHQPQHPKKGCISRLRVRVVLKAFGDEAGDLAHAVQIPVTTANQWISQAPVNSLLVQAESESKRAIWTSRETTEISEPPLMTQHGGNAPIPPWIRPGLSDAFLPSQVICCPRVEAPPPDRVAPAGAATPNKSAELMTGRANW